MLREQPLSLTQIYIHPTGLFLTKFRSVAWLSVYLYLLQKKNFASRFLIQVEPGFLFMGGFGLKDFSGSLGLQLFSRSSFAS